jgi:hypothetical protein
MRDAVLVRLEVPGAGGNIGCGYYVKEVLVSHECYNQGYEKWG